MKRLFLTFILLEAASLSSFAQQETRVNAYGAYSFEDKVDSYYDSYNYYEGKIGDGLLWGAGIEHLPTPEVGIELSYMRKETTAPITYLSGSNLSGIQHTTFDMNMNYALLGFNRYVRKEGSIVEGFAGATLGAGWAYLHNRDNGRESQTTKFAWGLRAGANVWVSPNIALKFQAQLLSVVQSVGGSVYFGTGGAGAGLGLYSSIYQFMLGGGLIYKLGK